LQRQRAALDTPAAVQMAQQPGDSEPDSLSNN
jgi:hypothetical protein